MFEKITFKMKTSLGNTGPRQACCASRFSCRVLCLPALLPCAVSASSPAVCISYHFVYQYLAARQFSSFVCHFSSCFSFHVISLYYVSIDLIPVYVSLDHMCYPLVSFSWVTPVYVNVYHFTSFVCQFYGVRPVCVHKPRCYSGSLTLNS